MVNDVELLQAMVVQCLRLRDAAMSHAAAQFATPLTDDPRWLSPYPLRPELQLRHLFLQALDAYDASVAGLHHRTSSAAVGSIRLLAECCVIVRWLTEVDGAERRKRSYRLTMDGIVRMEQMRKHGVKWASKPALDAMKQRLNELAREDGVQYVREAPDAKHLFDKYLRGGYEVLSILSELGSHPGFFQAVLFHLDEAKTVMAVDLERAHADRAMWVATAFELLGYTLDGVGSALGWKAWLDAEALPIVKDAATVMPEVRTRWMSKWGIGANPPPSRDG